MKFSIVIPIRQVTDYLRESVEYLKKLDYEDFEVIIVTDKGATTEGLDVDGRFIFGESKHPGPAQKRNIGVSMSSGEILAFLDDDAFPESDWLSKAAKVFKDTEVYALGGPATTPKDAGFAEKMSGRVLESFLTSGGTTYRHIPKTKRYINDYPTVNLFIKKEAFIKVGGFSEVFWPGEDTKICLDLIKEYKRDFLYDPEVRVYHHRRNLFIPHLKQVSRYGKHRGQFARIFPETSRLPSYFIPSLFLLGLVLGPVISYFIPSLWFTYYFVISVYLLALFIEGVRILVKEPDSRSLMYATVGIFLTHVIYGLNFIYGYFSNHKSKFRNINPQTGNYLGG